MTFLIVYISLNFNEKLIFDILSVMVIFPSLF
jgi:hypothetical protein